MMKKQRATRVLRIAAIVLGLYVGLSVICTAIFAMVFFGRYDGDQAPMPASYEEITFPSGDHMLTGWIRRHEQAPGVVVMLQGFHSTSSEYTDIADSIWQSGWDVMLYDGTGVGRSEGRGTVGLQQSVPDGNAALDWLRRQEAFRDLPVCLWGYSAGGYAAAILAAERGDIAGAILLSSFDSPVEMMLTQAEDTVGPLVRIEEPFLRAWQAIRFGADADRRASDALMRSTVPVLVIHGEADRTVPVALSLYERLRAAGRPGTELLLLPGADHRLLTGAPVYDSPDAWYGEFSDFCLALPAAP